MNASVAKKTQDTLGKVIKKPPLTEKLLSKPPFRYLHDIVTEVIRTTGFMKGLYEEAEMKSDNVKDKDAKIAFLQKAIDVVVMVSGELLSVKPARIVAGHEAEKTNELLQAMGKCCLSKLSSEDAVKRVLAGEKPDPRGKPSSSKFKDKENQEGMERHRDKELRKEIKERSSSRDKKDSAKDTEGKRPEKEQSREGERPEKGREHERTRERERERDKEKAKEREPHRERERERRRQKDKERERPREPVHTDRKGHGAGDKPSKQSQEHLVRNGRQDAEAEDEPAEASQTQKSPARIPRPSSAKGQRRLLRPGGQDDSDSDGGPDAHSEKAVPVENGDVLDSQRPSTTLSNRRIPRPSSARPAPPRVKKQEGHSEPVPTESAKPSTAVIVDGKKLSEDEEDDDQQFVVEEAAPLPTEVPELKVDPQVEFQENEMHGSLVKKILKTKKEYETSPLPAKSKEQEWTVLSEAARRKERELVSREVERQRLSIQTVCRSALPLGRIMDYTQEDVDAMQAELQVWQRENREHAHTLQQEHRITESALEPLRAQLEELEQLIRDQQDKICTVKSNILRNEDKIHKMVSGSHFSSRT